MLSEQMYVESPSIMFNESISFRQEVSQIVSEVERYYQEEDQLYIKKRLLPYLRNRISGYFIREESLLADYDVDAIDISIHAESHLNIITVLQILEEEFSIDVFRNFYSALIHHHETKDLPLIQELQGNYCN